MFNYQFKKERMRLIILLILVAHSLNLFSAESINNIRPDGDKKKDSAWISQDDKIILGSEISQFHMNLDFDNVFHYVNDNSLFVTRTYKYWKFNTSNNPSGISYYVNSRFGKINFFSHKIPGTEANKDFSTSFTNLGYA